MHAATEKLREMLVVPAFGEADDSESKENPDENSDENPDEVTLP